jgi:hypothetical protein
VDACIEYRLRKQAEAKQNNLPLGG